MEVIVLRLFFVWKVSGRVVVVPRDDVGMLYLINSYKKPCRAQPTDIISRSCTKSSNTIHLFVPSYPVTAEQKAVEKFKFG